MLSIALALALSNPARAEEAPAPEAATTPGSELPPFVVPSALLVLDPDFSADPANEPGGLDAVAEGEEDDQSEDSVKSEKDAVKSGKAETKSSAEPKRKRKVIKTIQPKTFMKLHRYEAGAALGFVANDPFLNRYILSGVFDYHATEIFAIEAQLGYSPILGEGGCDDPDWKPLSCQLITKNSVSPDVSRLTAHGSLALAFSPIYGKVAVGDSIIAFDIYGAFGIGATQTTDDLLALQAEDEPPDGPAHLTANEVHPTTVMGGGARIALSEGFALRTEVKSMTYIETVKSSVLEMKNNLIVQVSGTFFVPGMK